jgi:hypothetical protein
VIAGFDEAVPVLKADHGQGRLPRTTVCVGLQADLSPPIYMHIDAYAPIRIKSSLLDRGDFRIWRSLTQSSPA